jgi:hypothetical protein
MLVYHGSGIRDAGFIRRNGLSDGPIDLTTQWDLARDFASYRADGCVVTVHLWDVGKLDRACTCCGGHCPTLDAVQSINVVAVEAVPYDFDALDRVDAFLGAYASDRDRPSSAAASAETYALVRAGAHHWPAWSDAVDEIVASAAAPVGWEGS